MQTDLLPTEILTRLRITNPTDQFRIINILIVDFKNDKNKRNEMNYSSINQNAISYFFYIPQSRSQVLYEF